MKKYKILYDVIIRICWLVEIKSSLEGALELNVMAVQGNGPEILSRQKYIQRKYIGAIYPKRYLLFFVLVFFFFHVYSIYFPFSQYSVYCADLVSPQLVTITRSIYFVVFWLSISTLICQEESEEKNGKKPRIC